MMLNCELKSRRNEMNTSPCGIETVALGKMAFKVGGSFCWLPLCVVFVSLFVVFARYVFCSNYTNQVNHIRCISGLNDSLECRANGPIGVHSRACVSHHQKIVLQAQVAVKTSISIVVISRSMIQKPRTSDFKVLGDAKGANEKKKALGYNNNSNNAMRIGKRQTVFK
jgi:hypothetical protein